MFDMNWKLRAFPVTIHPIADDHHNDLNGGKRGHTKDPATPAAQEPTARSASGSCARRRKRRSVNR